MHHTSFTSACNACRAYRPCIAWTRKIAGQCTHCHRTNRKTSAVSVTHRCKRSADREQLGCHDYQTARRSRHRIETCDSPFRLRQIFAEVAGTLLGSQLTKADISESVRCARRTNCSTVASGVAQPYAMHRPCGDGRNAPTLRGGQDSLPLRKFSDVRTGGTSIEPCTPFEGQNIFHSIGARTSRAEGRTHVNRTDGEKTETCVRRTTALIEGRGFQFY